MSPFSAFLGFSSSLETQSSSHSLSIGSLGPCFSTVGIGGQLLMGTEGPPQFCVCMQWGKGPTSLSGRGSFFHESDIFSESANATANCKRGSCSQKCLFVFEMELETTAWLQAKHAWSWNSTSANQGGMSENWFGQAEGRQELGWDESSKFVG